MVNGTELFYFPRKKLLCTSHDGVNFWVINGNWSFELQGEVGVTPAGESIDTGEYEEHTRASFNECYPDFGY